MKRQLLFLFIILLGGFQWALAQTDSTRQKHWSFGIGILSGVNQLHPSTQVHYDKVINYVDAAIAGEAYIQYHFSRKWAASLGLRLSRKVAYSDFSNQEAGMFIFVNQVASQIPLLLEYKIENSAKKEIVTVEAGVLFRGLNDDYPIFWNTTSVHAVYYKSQKELSYYEDYNQSSCNYYSGIVKMSKKFPFTKHKSIKAFVEYDFSFPTYSVDLHMEYPGPRKEIYDTIALQSRTLYIGATLLF